ncbi:type VII secretion protein EccB [Streptomyces sp. NPDC044984]|uniref:type VII secretion protein EccB n=1 Tax=Streptomyces sp. NPDC044984 TaxID=3154335 RepID=UPI0033EB54ED
MHSKRDQIQAHLFIMGRLASAMLRSDPDEPESPLGRTNRGAAIGVLIALLICAGFFVFGLVKPGGNNTWRSTGNLVLDKQTGARYLYLDGRLRPVRNYASAQLLAGGEPTVKSVRTDSLKGTPHGTPLGIPDGPEALPAAADLDTGPWLVCSAVRTRSTDVVQPATVLAIGTDAADQVPGARGLGNSEAVLVRGSDGTSYLVWRGMRLRLDADANAAGSLGYGGTDARPVSAAFLDAFPQGPDLAAPEVPGQGARGPSLAGRSSRVGQLFRVTVPGSGPRYHVLLKEGLAPVSDTEALLLMGDPRTRVKAYGGADVTVRLLGADALSEHLAPSSAAVTDAALPATPPRLVSVPATSVACAGVVSADGELAVDVRLLPDTALPEPVQNPAPQVQPACLTVDAVAVRPGKGALVNAVGAGGDVLGDTTYAVTDDGVKYRVTSQDALKALGYGDAERVAVPAQLLSMLPSGPDLSPAAAQNGTARISLRCPANGTDN